MFIRLFRDLEDRNIGYRDVVNTVEDRFVSCEIMVLNLYESL